MGRSIIKTVIKQRSDTELAWTAANPLLSIGEIGFESNSGRFKIGDGVTRWTALAYHGADAETKINQLQASKADKLKILSITINTPVLWNDTQCIITNDTITKSNHGLSSYDVVQIDVATDGIDPIPAAIRTTDDVWYVYKIDNDNFQLLNQINNTAGLVVESLVSGLTQGSNWSLRMAGGVIASIPLTQLQFNKVKTLSLVGHMIPTYGQNGSFSAGNPSAYLSVTLTKPVYFIQGINQPQQTRFTTNPLIIYNQPDHYRKYQAISASVKLIKTNTNLVVETRSLYGGGNSKNYSLNGLILQDGGSGTSLFTNLVDRTQTISIETILVSNVLRAILRNNTTLTIEYDE